MRRPKSLVLTCALLIGAVAAVAFAGVAFAGAGPLIKAAATNVLRPSAKPEAIVEYRSKGVISLPGRFQAEDYRAGGPGVGYVDMTATNLGAVYRDDAVDLQPVQGASGRFNVGWIDTGEWLAYDVEFSESGDYVFTVPVSTPYDCLSPQRFHIELDEVDVTGPIAVPNTGGWQRWEDVVTGPTTVEAGSYTLKIASETGGFNLNYVEVREATSGSVREIQMPGRIQAEEYRDGGEGVGYHDTTEGNFCGAYRNDDVDTQICDDINSPCYNVGWSREGEWLAYDVRFEKSSDYIFTLRVATIHDDGSFHIELDGTDVTGPIAVPNTEGWQSWVDVVSEPITIDAGSYTLTIVNERGRVNLNYLDVAEHLAAAIDAAFASPWSLHLVE